MCLCLLCAISALRKVQGCLRGLKSALPDFTSNGKKGACIIVGHCASRVGDSQLRERVARVLHMVLEHMLRDREDDTAALILALSNVDMVLNAVSTSTCLVVTWDAFGTCVAPASEI